MTLPETMQAIVARAPGSAEVLEITRRPLPSVGEQEVLIQVVAAGVNRADIMQRKGRYPPPPDASDLLGLEVAGRVAKTGARVNRWKIGDAVCALANGGGYAEYCAVPEGQCLPLPEGVDFIGAASLPETYFTVWSNVFDRAHLAPGETLLVQGGASGIGVTAIQLAHAFGSSVYATAGTVEKCAAIENLGASRTINYRTEDFVAVIEQATAGRGVDVILDIIGGEYTPRELKSLACDGRIVWIATMGGYQADIDLRTIMLRRLTLTGSTLRPRNNAFKAAIARQLQDKVWPLFAAGKIHPVIYRVFPLADAAQAHALMESGAHIGKIVLKVAE